MTNDSQAKKARRFSVFAVLKDAAERWTKSEKKA